MLQIGVDFALKVLNWDQNTLIRLQLWDIAGSREWYLSVLSVSFSFDHVTLGQERYGNMTRVRR